MYNTYYIILCINMYYVLEPPAFSRGAVTGASLGTRTHVDDPPLWERCSQEPPRVLPWDFALASHSREARCGRLRGGLSYLRSRELNQRDAISGA